MRKFKIAVGRLLDSIKNTANSEEIAGIEKGFDVVIVFLRIISVSYWIKSFLPDPVHNESRVKRDRVIEAYVLLQLLTLVILFQVSQLYPKLACFVASYILFEMFLNLFSILFLGKLSKVNAPPASTERSLLLFIVNACQLILSFSIFYQVGMGLPKAEAFLNAVLVLGTVGHPLNKSMNGWYIVAAQILLDFIFVLLFVGAFVGQYKVFGNKQSIEKK